MDRWVIYAGVSAVFAGVTAVLAKHGLEGIPSQLALAVRTVFLLGMTLAVAWVTVPLAEWGQITWHNHLWLGISAATTTASWVFYYLALKGGDVGTVALIDKGSFVVAVLMGWVVLREEFSWRVAAGAAIILAGVIVAGWKR